MTDESNMLQVNGVDYIRADYVLTVLEDAHREVLAEVDRLGKEMAALKEWQMKARRVHVDVDARIVMFDQAGANKGITHGMPLVHPTGGAP